MLCKHKKGNLIDETHEQARINSARSPAKRCTPMTQAYKSLRFRVFLTIWAAGIIGSTVLIFTVLPQMLPALLKGRPLPVPMWVVYSSAIIQNGVLLAVAAWLGALLAPAIGLHAPVVESVVSGQRALPKLRAQLLPALITGSLIGVFLFLVNTYGPNAWVSVQSQYYPSLLTRLLAGGLMEEVLLRWGVMTTLAWVLWRVFQRQDSVPRAALMWAAIVISALLFGLGHLPAVAKIVGGLTVNLAIFIVTANMIAGVMFGWLYWRFGLECAMIAHAMAHLINYFAGLV